MNSNNKSYRRRYGSRENGGPVLQLFRLIASESILWILLCIWQLIAVLGIAILSIRLEKLVAPTKVLLPDMRFMGYTSQQIYDEFYNIIGVQGCQIYSTLALWDIFVLIPAYTLLLGTFYVFVTRQTYDKVSFHAGGYWNADKRAYLVLPIAICDVIETTIQHRGCTLLIMQQSKYLSNVQVHVGSTAVSLKWSLIALFFVSIVERLCRGYICKNVQTTYGQERILPLWM